MLSTQFVRSKTGAGTATSYQQNQDFQSLFLSLSGLNLTEAPAPPNGDSGILVGGSFPSAQHVVFGHSSFFKRNPGHKDLPLPNDVRAEAARQFPGANGGQEAANLVAIPSLGLLVKYGTAVQVNEAKTLLTLRRFLPQQVLVPEVFGWQRDNNENFIYMSLPEGITLADSWDMLSEDQKAGICTQIKDIVKSWRRLRQNNCTRTRIGSKLPPPSGPKDSNHQPHRKHRRHNRPRHSIHRLPPTLRIPHRRRLPRMVCLNRHACLLDPARKPRDGILPLPAQQLLP